MLISLFQQNIVWLNPDANYTKIESLLQSHPDTELLVLPEMCSTGFVTNPGIGQIETADAVERRLLSLSSRYGTAICGSFAITLDAKEDSLIVHRNRCYFVTPEGEIFHSDKHHLFNIGGENRGYTPGQERVIVSWHGIRFLLLVCYDLRFPVWARYTETAPYDIMICVANWPQQRRLAWDTLLPARAIENQVFVIGVNRVGQDNLCPYDGGTRAIHPYGHILAQCPDGEESVCSFIPDMQKLEDFRKKFPSQMDSDIFVLPLVEGLP